MLHTKQETAKSIRYVQFHTNQGTGYGCFAIEWYRDGKNINFSVGASFCNSKDMFRKERAREIACGRQMKKDASIFSFRSDVIGFITDDEFYSMLGMMRDVIDMPSWATKAIVKGNYTLTLRKKLGPFAVKRNLKLFSELLQHAAGDKTQTFCE